MFENIIGNNKIKNLLENSIKQGNVSHSYLFIGIDGIGKKLIAKELSKYVLCLNNGCNNTCKSCIEFESNNHPDFEIIEPDGNSIKIEQKKETDNKKNTQQSKKTIKKIAIKGISKQIAAGKSIKLITSILPKNAKNKLVTWKTSNKKVATVDKNGVVKVNKKAAGKTVTITAIAKDGSNKKATYKIKVMKGSVKSISIKGKKTVKAGKTLKLTAKVKASKGANKKLIWKSSNTKYATVSSSGKVIAKKTGKKKTVIITVMSTDGTNKKKTVKIKIK